MESEARSRNRFDSSSVLMNKDRASTNRAHAKYLAEEVSPEIALQKE